MHIPMYSDADVNLMKAEFERIAVDQETQYAHAVDENRALKHQISVKEHENRELAHRIESFQQSQQLIDHQKDQITALRSEIKRLQQVNYALLIHLQKKEQGEASSHHRQPPPPPDIF